MPDPLPIGLPPEEVTLGRSRSPHIGAYEASFDLANLFTNAQQVSATVNCRQLLGRDQVARIEPSGALRSVPLDGVDSIPYLKQLGIGEAERQIDLLHDRFFGAPAEPFAPCHRLDGAARKGPSEAGERPEASIAEQCTARRLRAVSSG